MNFSDPPSVPRGTGAGPPCFLRGWPVHQQSWAITSTCFLTISKHPQGWISTGHTHGRRLCWQYNHPLLTGLLLLVRERELHTQASLSQCPHQGAKDATGMGPAEPVPEMRLWKLRPVSPCTSGAAAPGTVRGGRGAWRRGEVGAAEGGAELREGRRRQLCKGEARDAADPRCSKSLCPRKEGKHAPNWPCLCAHGPQGEPENQHGKTKTDT